MTTIDYAVTEQVSATKNTPLRRIVATLNNYTDSEYDSCVAFAKTCKWAIIGKEKGESGTPHLQCAFIFGKQIRFNTLKNMDWGKRACIFAMKGTPLQNKEYCGKDGDFVEFGDSPKPGKRSDLLPCVEHLKKGGTMRDLVEDDAMATVFVKYSNGLNRLCTLVAKRRRREFLRVYWFHGPTGSGKSSCAFEVGESIFKSEYWETSDSCQWFDSYSQQKYAIFDDFRPRTCKFEFFLRLLDPYPVRAPIKGGFTEWSPNFIVITTTKSPTELYAYRGEKLPEDLKQLTRRIHGIFQFPGERDQAIHMFSEDYKSFRSLCPEHTKCGGREEGREGGENDSGGRQSTGGASGSGSECSSLSMLSYESAKSKFEKEKGSGVSSSSKEEKGESGESQGETLTYESGDTSEDFKINSDSISV